MCYNIKKYNNIHIGESMPLNEIKRHGTEDFPFEIYYVDKTHPKYEMVLHYHTNIEIIRIIEGSLDLTLDDKKIKATQNTIYFVNSGSLHGAIPHNCTYQCLVFNPEFIKIGNSDCDEFIDNLLSRNIEINPIINSNSLSILTNSLFDSISKRKDGFQFAVIGIMNQIFGIIKSDKLFSSKICGIKNIDTKSVKLKKVLSFIRNNFDKEISLSDMAKACNLSTKYFCSFFKQETGKSPFEYLVDYRIEKACSIILSSDLPITQISFLCGFNDLSYFIKTFKKLKGTTPNQYRKNLYN